MDPKPRVFFDTNVLLYLAGRDAAKADRAELLLVSGGYVSVQVLNEFVSVSRRKATAPWSEMRGILDAVRLSCDVVPLTVEVHDLGVNFIERYRLAVYDSMIVAAAVIAGCTTLYSEDMHHGLVIDGLMIRNPFAAT